MESSTLEVKSVSAHKKEEGSQRAEMEREKRRAAEGGREGGDRRRGGCRRLGRPVRLREVLVRRPAGKWKKKGARRLPEASLGPSVLSFRRQVFH